jgi:probable HAF family extracellular repeat protein
MRRADPSLITVNRRISRTIFVALVVGSIALLSLGTRPAETQETFAQPLYKVQDLGTLGGPWSQAAGINDAGKVVGGSPASDEGGVHAFLYSGGQMSDLGTLGGDQSRAFGINDADKVVGSSDVGDGTIHAFLYSDGVMRDLNSLIPAHSGFELTSAAAINDNGNIVGYGYNQGSPGP